MNPILLVLALSVGDISWEPGEVSPTPRIKPQPADPFHKSNEKKEVKKKEVRKPQRPFLQEQPPSTTRATTVPTVASSRRRTGGGSSSVTIGTEVIIPTLAPTGTRGGTRVFFCHS